MNTGSILGQGVSFPFRVGTDGRIAWSSGEANIREAIRVILTTEPHERVMLPDFGAGLRKLLFEPNTAATRARIQQLIATALAQWEPRISLQSVSVDEDPNDPKSAIATIVYTLVTTQTQQRVSLTVTLA
jgi:phage baseplate assembly protein W